MTENPVFNEIYSKYKNLVLRTAYMYLGSLDVAEDIMQDTFVALYRDMKSKEIEDESGYTNIKSWLYTTTKHLALNYKRSLARKPVVEEFEDGLALEVASDQNVEEEYIGDLTEEKRRELHERIFTALAEKNPRWYEAIKMACLLDIPQKEAARRMGMTENAFYVMLHRARNWIYEEFGVDYEELDKY